MSQEVEQTLTRAAGRLRGMVSAWQTAERADWTAEEIQASDDRRAAQLEDIAVMIEGQLVELRQARERQERYKEMQV